MGSKPSNAMESHRPESGGTIKDEVQEQSGLRERDKEEFAQSEQKKRDAKLGDAGHHGTSNNVTSEKGELND